MDIMFGGFSAKKLKPQLKMACSRLQIAANKKSALSKQQMREIAVMLADENPKEELAKIRAEALIREDNCIEAYEILQLECELLAERIKLLENMKTCPPDLKSCVCTLIWATDRVDISELPLIRKQFRYKYGKDFEEAAVNNVGGVLNERVVSKLSVQPPAASLVQTYLEQICEQYEVDWKPSMVNNNEAAVPTAAPVGYSVQVAAGTGLGPVVLGQETTDEEINYQPPPKGDVPTVPSASVFVPDDDEFGNVDIFVPTIPTAPPGSTIPPKAPGDNNDDGGDENNNGDAGGGGSTNNTGGSSVDSSYASLAARFDKLNK